MKNKPQSSHAKVSIDVFFKSETTDWMEFLLKLLDLLVQFSHKCWLSARNDISDGLAWFSSPKLSPSYWCWCARVWWCYVRRMQYFGHTFVMRDGMRCPGSHRWYGMVISLLIAIFSLHEGNEGWWGWRLVRHWVRGSTVWRVLTKEKEDMLG